MADIDPRSRDPRGVIERARTPWWLWFWQTGRELAIDLNDLSPEQLRTLAAELIAQVGEKDRELLCYRQTRIDQLTHEISILKRLKLGKRSEQLNAEQASLLDETIDADLDAIETELEHSNQIHLRKSNVSSRNGRRCRLSCRAPIFIMSQMM